jgi:hypothetical protein
VTLAFQKTIPLLRIFSVEKAKEFYVDYMGLRSIGNTTSRRNPGLPASVQGGLTLHLSEHQGDCCPGSTALLWMTGIEEFDREIAGGSYKYLRPGLETTSPAGLEQMLFEFGLPVTEGTKRSHRPRPTATPW